jgi:hypothetical protein
MNREINVASQICICRSRPDFGGWGHDDASEGVVGKKAAVWFRNVYTSEFANLKQRAHGHFAELARMQSDCTCDALKTAAFWCTFAFSRKTSTDRRRKSLPTEKARQNGIAASRICSQKQLKFAVE